MSRTEAPTDVSRASVKKKKRLKNAQEKELGKVRARSVKREDKPKKKK